MESKSHIVFSKIYGTLFALSALCVCVCIAGGVFLLLGYSAADEALLRPHTNLGVQDAVRALQQYVTTYINNQVSRRPRAPLTTLAPFVTYSNINCNSLLLRLLLLYTDPMHTDSIQHDRGEHYYCRAAAARWQAEGYRGAAPGEGELEFLCSGIEKPQLPAGCNLIYSCSSPRLSVCLQDECTAILKTISHHINTEHNELQSHRLLSIFKMSEVDVVWPESTSAARSGHGHGQQTAANRLLTLLLLALAVVGRSTLSWRSAAIPT